jgi:diguanylate cyclase (GGDEF)-like protein
MSTPLRVLILEDRPADAALVLHELRRAGFMLDWQRAETAPEYLAGLDSPLDLILADYDLPAFNALQALQLLHERGLDIPFIIVSGTIGEERAVLAIKQGATDYLLKDRLARLGPAVQQALEQKRLRDAKRDTEAALQQSEALNQAVLDSLPTRMAVLDKDGTIIAVNAAWRRLAQPNGGAELPGTGVGINYLAACRQVSGEGAATALAICEGIQAVLDGGHDHFNLEYPYRTPVERRWFAMNVTPMTGARGGVVLAYTDITERKRAEEQLRQHAFYDSLTGLPNRALFLDRLERAVARARRSKKYMFAVLFLDLDRFKTINDSLGHLVGDQLVIAMARRVEACVRGSDTVARFGGDEFAILLDDIAGVTAATLVAEYIQAQLMEPITLLGNEVVTTASIGIALSTTGYKQPEEILRDADIALYRAKAQGKARYELFDTAMYMQIVGLLQLEAELRRAVQQQELCLYYQPIVSLDDGMIVGVEALIRWRHPERGLIAPAEFIPLAEETGLIVPLGEWGLQTACAQMKAWHDEGLPHLCVAVNLSARQFRHKGISTLIERVVGETGLDPQYLRLELTESNIMDNVEETITVLHELRATGVQLAVDDFGTGYSSLSYLKRFPISILKIDRSFMSDTITDPNGTAIITAMIAMAHSLSLQVIAEGVETNGQLAFLQAQRCDAIQGYLFSRPLPASAVMSFVREGR